MPLLLVVLALLAAPPRILRGHVVDASGAPVPGASVVAVADADGARNPKAQVNVENLFDGTYYVNADSNTNISPGSPRAVRLGMTTEF